jgi:hypothetical protein
MTDVITEAGLVQAVADVIDPPDAVALAAKLFAWAPKMPAPADDARGEATVEYAHEMASGDYHLWNTEPWTDEIYPLADRIRSGQRDYGSVYRRRVVVIEDWAEVAESASDTTGKTP